jgi:hypothetical protein
MGKGKLPMRSHEDEIQIWAAQQIQEFFQKGVYGKVTLHIQDGGIVQITKERTEKPPINKELTNKDFY